MSRLTKVPWSPLARGFLTRPHTESSHRAKTDKNYGNFVGVGDPTQTEALNAINEAVERIAKKRGVSMAQVALAWVLARPGVTAPIVGSTKVSSIEELVQATHITLTQDEIEEINEPYKPRRIYGHS